MKNKILTVVLSIALAFTLVLATFNAYAASNLEIGDTNGDGKIDLEDVVHLAQYVAGWDVELGEQTSSDTVIGEVNFNNSNEENIWESLPNKNAVNVLMWREYSPTEQKLIDDYEKLTGVDVVTTVTTEREYATKLVSMVSDGNSPDLVRFSTNYFPSLPRKCLSALDETEFDLDADCWNKTYMDAYKINGRYYGVSMPGSWLCEDTAYVTYYSPALLKKCGVTTMPYDLYKSNQWNWDTQSDIIRKVENYGYNGLSLQSYDLYMHSAGQDFVSFDGEQFTNKLGALTSSDMLSQAWQEAATLNIDDCLSGWALDDFKQNKVGLFTGITYGLYSEGDWFSSDFASGLEAVPVAGPRGSTAYTPAAPGCWAVPKNAKNSAGAAYFIRYFLDTSNYDQSSTFHNSQFEEVFNTITKTTAKKSIMYGSGITDYIETGAYSKLCNTLISTLPSNITTQLNSKKGTVNTGLSRANKDLVLLK